MSDHANYKALRSVIRSGIFDIKGEAVTTVAALLQWYDSLEDRFIEKKPKRGKDVDK